MKMVLLGPPGAGKGTQAERLSKHLDVPTISTGAIIRNEIKEKTQLGVEAHKYISEGKLVPDSLVISMVKERLSKPDCSKGFILDGFPRTIEQAQTLDSMTDITKVLCIKVKDEEILNRLSGRRECKVCRASYHIMYNKPAKEGICDKCGGELICREDDTVETIKNRIAVYHEQTEPIIQYYASQGKLAVVEGRDDVEDTTKAVFEALDI